MGRPRVCVVADSQAIRATADIVLGVAFEVDLLSPEACEADATALAAADALVISGDFSPGPALQAAAQRLPVLAFEGSAAAARLSARRLVTVPFSLRPEQLRRRLQDLLSAAPTAAPAMRSYLDYPWLPQDLVALARRAVETDLPVLLCGEAGTGKSRIARAIHSARRPSRFVPLPAARLSTRSLEHAGQLGPGPLTLYVADVAELDSEAQHLLLEVCQCGGFESLVGWHEVRVIAATRSTLSDLAAAESFESDLFYRLSVLAMTVPPIRHRTADLGHLVVLLARELGAGLGHEPFSFTEAAIKRMEQYVWSGNLAELEAVLLRSMVLAPGRCLEAADVLFDPIRLRRPPRAVGHRAEATPGSDTPGVPQEAPPAVAIPPESLELVIQELAHEFRNPMVTIKTLSQRLERLLEDKAGRDQVTRMTGEAVDRMDRVLENLLQFTRFGEPAAEPVPLSPLVTNCLSQLSSAFTERQVLLNYQPPDADLVTVDSAQVSYALENLLRVILRDLRDGDTLSIQPLDGRGIRLEFPARGQLAAEKLAELADNPRGDGNALSIGFFFAKALIERNGGKVEIHPRTGKTVIAVVLPGRGDVAADNGQAHSIGRR